MDYSIVPEDINIVSMQTCILITYTPYSRYLNILNGNVPLEWSIYCIYGFIFWDEDILPTPVI